MRDRALEPVPAARGRVAPGGVEHLDCRHLVHGQRAGLVGVDRQGEPQRFDRRQVLDDGLLLGQLEAAHREHHLDDGRQGFRDGRDGEGDRTDEERVLACPRWIPRANMITMVRPAAPMIQSVSVFIWRVSGVSSWTVVVSMLAIRPTWVSPPAPVTITTALPWA